MLTASTSPAREQPATHLATSCVAGKKPVSQHEALWEARWSLAQAIQVMRQTVDAFEEQHSDTIKVAVQELLLVVSTSLVGLDDPVLSAVPHPYRLLLKLSALHRSLLDAQVLASNVQSQCRNGRLATDPTGSYWHLRETLGEVVREYQQVLVVLKPQDEATRKALWNIYQGMRP